MEINFNELRDWNDGARRALDREREKVVERVELQETEVFRFSMAG